MCSTIRRFSQSLIDSCNVTTSAITRSCFVYFLPLLQLCSSWAKAIDTRVDCYRPWVHFEFHDVCCSNQEHFFYLNHYAAQLIEPRLKSTEATEPSTTLYSGMHFSLVGVRCNFFVDHQWNFPCPVCLDKTTSAVLTDAPAGCPPFAVRNCWWLSLCCRWCSAMEQFTTGHCRVQHTVTVPP